MSFLGQGRMRNPAPVLVPDSGTQNGSSFRPPYNNLYQGTHSRVQFWVRNLAPETVPFSGPRMSKSRHMPCACDVASDFWWTGCGRAAVSRRTARSLALVACSRMAFWLRSACNLAVVCLQPSGSLDAIWVQHGWGMTGGCMQSASGLAAARVQSSHRLESHDLNMCRLQHQS